MPISCGALWVMSYSFRGFHVPLVADNHLVSFGFRKYMVVCAPAPRDARHPLAGLSQGAKTFQGDTVAWITAPPVCSSIFCHLYLVQRVIIAPVFSRYRLRVNRTRHPSGSSLNRRCSIDSPWRFKTAPEKRWYQARSKGVVTGNDGCRA